MVNLAHGWATFLKPRPHSLHNSSAEAALFELSTSVGGGLLAPAPLTPRTGPLEPSNYTAP